MLFIYFYKSINENIVKTSISRPLSLLCFEVLAQHLHIQRNFSFSSRHYLSEEQIPADADLEHPSGRCIYIFVRCTNKEMFSLTYSVKLNLSSLNAQEASRNSVKL